MNRVLIVASALSLSACSGKAPEPATEKSPAPVAAPAKPAAPAPSAAPDPGQALYAAKCAGCHDLPDPKSHGDAAWAKEVQRMVQQKGAKLNADEVRQVTEYLVRVNGRD